MANQEQNVEKPDSQVSGVEPGEQCNVDARRRKFASAGLGVSAIFTLASQPVLAGICLSPSGNASGNLSQHGPELTCAGQKPADWILISAPDSLLDTKFHSVFKRVQRVNFGGNGPSNGPSMKQVMGTPNGNRKPQPLGAEFAAAWINIKKGLIPNTVITDSRLIVMWNELVDTGHYTPMTGATWLASSVITYLRSLQA